MNNSIQAHMAFGLHTLHQKSYDIRVK